MERVQFQQEQMLDELKDLVEKHLFTEKETKQIVKKRTAFETALVRRVAKKADFLRYASYEMGLELLRRKRAERTKSESTIPSISDYAIVRRQFHIFERAIRKFKSDVGLWIQYIQVAQREGARALVGRITARALQLHPNQPALYILAASHELSHQSPSSARTLLQRGIRLNAESVELWREYVKMELGFVENLRRRWEVLGINTNETTPSQGKPDTTAADPSGLIMPGVSDSAPADETMEEEEADGADARKEILQGAIIKSVMSSATQALAKIELFESLQTLLTEYPLLPSLRKTLLEHLYTLSSQVLPNDAGAIKLRASRFLAPDLQGEALVDGLRQANEELQQAMAGAASEEVFQVYAAFVEEWCGVAIDGNMKLYLISSLRSLCSKEGASPSLLSAHIRLVTNRIAEGAAESPAKVLRLARKYCRQARSSAPVWLARLEAERQFGEGRVAVNGAWKEARGVVDGTAGEVEGVWIWGLSGTENEEEGLRMHEALLKESMGKGGLHEMLLIRYVGAYTAHGQPATGVTSDQDADRDRWLGWIRHMASAYLTSGAVWQTLFGVVRGQKREVVEAVYVEWAKQARVEATVAWAAWLSCAGDGAAAAGLIGRGGPAMESAWVARVFLFSSLLLSHPSLEQLAGVDGTCSFPRTVGECSSPLHASPSSSHPSLSPEQMLQYPVQLPPLSLSSSPKLSQRPNDPLLASKRFPKDPFRPPFSTLHSSSSSSPISLPRSPRLPDAQLAWPPSKSAVASRQSSSSSSVIEDVLAPGDFVGQGGSLQGETIRLVLGHAASGASQHQEPAQEFQVKRRLGHGSYAVVYLVQEVLYRPQPSEDGHMSIVGMMELDNNKPTDTVYGREYAIKCLSKANLDEEDLAAQMSEVTIHQSLRAHPNIVTLHRTLETSSFLLLLLEYVPGEDLFYFLEQARDHYDSEVPNTADSSVSHTPPTPSLLSTLHPAQLLSRTRLRLISSMFAQMCDAVAACHDQSVFHRDIKPENFIVTDGWITSPNGRQERKVIVKLTDFGLSTTDLASSDMDCGSAPYMSYECRNNVAPTYRPRAADVWSLGIVLINMLYHSNPWTDTSQGTCSSFDLYRRDPINFFMYRFAGMTRPVAEHLANKVFCILEDPEDDSPRITAGEFGTWARHLPSLLGSHSIHRTVSSSSQGHPIAASTPLSHRPSSRHPSVTSAVRSPAIRSRSLSRAPSLSPAYEGREHSDLSTVFDHEPEPEENEQEQDDRDVDILEGMESRSTSTNKRRKRGARKGKGVAASDAKDETLATLADASQSLAREISKASRSSSKAQSVSSRNTGTTSSSRRAQEPFEPVSLYPMPTALLPSPRTASTSTSRGAPSARLPPASTVSPPPVTKKPSKWKLSFGKASASTLTAAHVSPVEEVSPPSSVDTHTSASMSTTASNVTNLIMGLNAPSPSTSPSSDDSSSTWSRGRRDRTYYPPPSNSSNRSLALVASRSPEPGTERWERRNDRAVSPNNSTRSGRPLASSASSVVSSNWRSSMSTTSSAGTSTSAFTRYSNSSARSISTTATSVSSASWRTNVKPQPSINSNTGYAALPKNIKIMDGVPWELDQLPRGQHPKPVGDIFGSPPVRKQRTKKTKDLKLDTITERPQNAAAGKSLEAQRRDASTSTTDLGGLANGKDEGDGAKKVQKGQINALAKMLSALRR
ncbi:hypothetical protein H0H87_007071 [Tephrocybe sp. NHM501043]|nr:hypothetical protein H0H87_007071 [Tephrocybe sp. NHM501043]